MREEFAARYPGPTERLRFADVLILAGRDAEALPVLLGVADEQERYGFREKALEALRRAGEIAPGDPEVADRLELIRREPAERGTRGRRRRRRGISGDPGGRDQRGLWELDGAGREPGTRAERRKGTPTASCSRPACLLDCAPEGEPAPADVDPE